MQKVLLVILLLLSVGCTKALFTDDDLVIDQTNGHDYSLFDIYTDNDGEQGIVIGMRRGNICILSTDETTLPWGKEGAPVLSSENVTSDALVSMHLAQEYGLNNYPAFKWCFDKNKVGEKNVAELGNWLLPSASELIFVDTYYEEINTVLFKLGYPVVEGAYWSSGCSNNMPCPFSLPLSCLDDSAVPQTTPLKVRACKYIYYKYK